MLDIQYLEKLARLIRYYILISTAEAGSGHPSSSLSAVELMTVLFFGGFFRYDPENIENPNNDRIIFSKGHASPLLYALWTVSGKISENDLLNMRKFNSPLEGHPTASFKYTEAATGSLGQGLSIGVGMALNAKYLDKLKYKTYVLLGDSEMSEGSIWEAIQIASYYKLNNLIGIIDVNRLGQCGETMYGHNIKAYEKRISSFGWKTITIDGHSIIEIINAYKKATLSKEKPVMIIAKTIKGKGVSFFEDKIGWHGKVPPKEIMYNLIKELGNIDKTLKGKIEKPKQILPKIKIYHLKKTEKIYYPQNTKIATRKAYGNALVKIYPKYPDIVVLDAEVSNSTYSEIFKSAYPERFFEMFIAEQNMVGVALGLSRRGKIPFVSSFGAFLTRAYDQIRMCQYSNANIKFCGSHAGVSIGEDGPSQMGLEDISMFRTILNSVIFYPSDAISTEKLVEESAKHYGIVYIRTTRQDTPIIYSLDEVFSIGGCKVLKKSDKDIVTVISAGITLHEAIKAYEELQKEGINIRIIDLYCIKPIDRKTIQNSAYETKAIITVEDHFQEGGIGEAVRSCLNTIEIPIYSLSVKKMPKSGKPHELLDYEGISKNAIINKIKEII